MKTPSGDPAGGDPAGGDPAGGDPAGGDPAGGIAMARLIPLALSAFLVLAAEPLYLLVDTAVVGHLGTGALAALGVGATLMSVLGVLGAFVEYGTTARAARWFGAGRTDAAVGEGVQASYLALAIGIPTVVAGELLTGPLTTLLTGGGGAVAHDAQGWLRIALLGMPGVLLVLAGNGWMRGVQRTREPVTIVLIANGVSALACPLLVYSAGWGLRGSAVANVAAQMLGAMLFLRALRRADAGQHRAAGGPRWRPVVNWPVLRAQLRLGRDLVVRSAAFQVAFLVAAGVAARLGSAQIAAHQIGLQLWEFTALLLDSLAIAAQSLVGAALGGAQIAAARAMSARVGRLGLYAGVVFAVAYAAGASVIPALFTSSAAVRAQAHVLWPWFVVMLPAAGVVFALDGVLIGAGDVAFLRTLTVVAALGVFAPLTVAAYFAHWGLGGVWAGLTAFVAARLVGMVARARGGRWAVVGTGEVAA